MLLWRWRRCFTGSIGRPVLPPVELVVDRARQDQPELLLPNPSGLSSGSFLEKHRLLRLRIFTTPMPRPTEIFLVFSIILTFLLVFILHLCYFLSEVIYCHDGYQYYFHFGNEVGIILVFHCFRISMHCYFYSMPTFGLNHTGFALYIH